MSQNLNCNNNIQENNFAIFIQNLVKTYDNKTFPINNISFNIPKGESVAILGKNGAGKTTLINIIASIIKKTSGTVKICNFDIDQDTISAKQQIGVMTQEPYLDVFLKLGDYIKTYASYYGLELSEEQVHKSLDTVGLLKNINNKPRELSGGMKRRFSLAKCMIHNPQILMLDEPTAAVDIDLSKSIISALLEQKKQGKNIILTTHHFHEVEQLCDRVIVIDNGIIQLDGLVHDILPKIKNGFNFLN